jgi:hypothetical protein
MVDDPTKNLITGSPTYCGETLIPNKNNRNSLITTYKNILTLYFHTKPYSRVCVSFTISKVKCMQKKVHASKGVMITCCKRMPLLHVVVHPSYLF